MIIDGNLVEKSSVFRSRFCIIGTGMGGSALAQKLVEASRDVLLVEAGGIDNAESGEAGRVGGIFVGNEFGPPVTRAVELGGTSNLWHGGWGMLDEVDFEPRPWIGCTGWPLRSADLVESYTEAAAQLGPGKMAEFDPAAIERKFPGQLNDLDFNRSVLEYKIIRIQRTPLRWKTTILELARAGRLRCILNACALELRTKENSGNVARLIAGVRSGTISIQSDVFIVCAGALETPRLLLNSYCGSRAGLCNEHGLVGRYLLDHPMGYFGKMKFRRPLKAALYADTFDADNLRSRVALKVSRQHQTSHKLTNNYLWIRPSITRKSVDHRLRLSFLGVKKIRDLTLAQIKGILGNPDIPYRILVYRLGFTPIYRYGDLVFVTEQLPNPDSWVRLSSEHCDRWGYPIAEVNWQLADADYACFERYTNLLFQSGLRSRQYQVARDEGQNPWATVVSSSAHHLGTARMGKSPAEGVVDRNLQAFGSDNLFVCDGSVFPTAGAVNPALTIMALARRLGGYLTSKQITRSS